jgi:Xaa-Pro aminopeptidase
MGFETLTLVPIDRRLVVKDMLSASEVTWLDTYHAHVREVIEPLLDEDAGAKAWLAAATKAL